MGQKKGNLFVEISLGDQDDLAQYSILHRPYITHNDCQQDNTTSLAVC